MAKAKSMSIADTLKNRLITASSLEYIDTLEKSVVFNDKDLIRTSIPALNVACSGELTGGFHSGLSIIAGPSKHFKSMLGLIFVRSYLRKYPEAICLFIDSEFGITPAYLKANGIDTNRVIHAPVEHIEQAKYELVKQLNNINRGEKLIIFFDSLGNCASKKEIDDAISESDKVDMTRAKACNSLARMITPLLNLNDVPMIVINHIYMTQGLFAKKVMSGGEKFYLSADQIFFMGRQQEKDSKNKEVLGYNFDITVEKSRFVQEKSVIPLNVTWEKGIDPFSGLLAMAKDCGIIEIPKRGYVSVIDIDSGEIIVDECKEKLVSKDVYMKILKMKKFNEYITTNYKIPEVDMNRQMHDDMDDWNNE